MPAGYTAEFTWSVYCIRFSKCLSSNILYWREIIPYCLKQRGGQKYVIIKSPIVILIDKGVNGIFYNSRGPSDNNCKNKNINERGSSMTLSNINDGVLCENS